jgi:hypothetical protein
LTPGNFSRAFSGLRTVSEVFGPSLPETAESGPVGALTALVTTYVIAGQMLFAEWNAVVRPEIAELDDYDGATWETLTMWSSTGRLVRAGG